MKARFQRALALLLVLVLTLGCIPAVSAVQPNEPVTNPEPAEEAAQLPEGSDLGAILQGSKDAELEALQPETPKDTDLVRVIVELDAPALTEQSGMFAGKALTDAGRTAQQNVIAAQEQVEAKIAEAAPEASVRYSYSLLLNGIALGMRLWPYRGAGSSARASRPSIWCRPMSFLRSRRLPPAAA